MKNILSEYYNISDADIFEVQGGFCADAFKIKSNEKLYFLKRYNKNRPVAQRYVGLIDLYTPIVNFLDKDTLANHLPKSIATNYGENYCEDENCVYLLYEYIQGTTIADKALLKSEVIELGGIVGKLHSDSYPEKDIPKNIYEDFNIEFNHKLSQFIHSDLSDYEFMKEHVSSIEKLTAKTFELREKAKNSGADFVLCHTDIHKWNLMKNSECLILIDWEGLKYAPKEADIFSLQDLPYSEDFMREYRKYNNNQLNQSLLDFYNCRRKSEDIWEYIEKLLFEKLSLKEKTETIDSIIRECLEMPWI